jgi:hypothetical protein
MPSKEVKLPDAHLKQLKETIKDHIRALNKAGVIDDSAEKPSLKTLQKVLGIEAGGTDAAPEQWLCGADTVCGVKV